MPSRPLALGLWLFMSTLTVAAAPATYQFTGTITFSATDASWVNAPITGSLVIDFANETLGQSSETFSQSVASYLAPFSPEPFGPPVVSPSFTLPGGVTNIDIAPPYTSLTSSVKAFYHTFGVDQFEIQAFQDGRTCTPTCTNEPRNRFLLQFRDENMSGQMITSSALAQVPNISAATSAVGEAFHVRADLPNNGFDFAYFVRFRIDSFTAVTPVPLPAAAWLFAGALLGLVPRHRRMAWHRDTRRPAVS